VADAGQKSAPDAERFDALVMQKIFFDVLLATAGTNQLTEGFDRFWVGGGIGKAICICKQAC